MENKIHDGLLFSNKRNMLIWWVGRQRSRCRRQHHIVVTWKRMAPTGSHILMFVDEQLRIRCGLLGGVSLGVGFEVPKPKPGCVCVCMSLPLAPSSSLFCSLACGTDVSAMGQGVCLPTRFCSWRAWTYPLQPWASSQLNAFSYKLPWSKCLFTATEPSVRHLQLFVWSVLKRQTYWDRRVAHFCVEREWMRARNNWAWDSTVTTLHRWLGCSTLRF